MQRRKGSALTIEPNALLNRPWDPGPKWTRLLDFCSYLFPIASAGLSPLAGIRAFHGANSSAAILGILAGVASAAGVMFTGLTSRIRDDRLAATHDVATLGLNIASKTSSQFNSGSYGG